MRWGPVGLGVALAGTLLLGCGSGVIKLEGFHCGGIAGLQCPQGSDCVMESKGPDSLGDCAVSADNVCRSKDECAVGFTCATEAGRSFCKPE